MFQNKPGGFGATTSNTYLGGFGAANTNPFGQPQPFGKPATTGFGNAPTAFGQPAAPLFGAQTQHGNNIFSTNSNTSFGQPPTTQTAFGSTLFGSTAQPSSSGLFGASSSSTSFGQPNKPGAFGFGAAGQSSVFGTPPVTPAQSSTNLFNPSTSTTNVFGSGGSTSSFGNSLSATTGTVLKFTHVTGTDTMQKGGVTQTISTRHHCITCMKEYETKSLEELRWEDYQANRKGPQQQTAFGNTPFGPTSSSSSTSLFGSQENKTLFGQTPGFGQTNAFGASQSQTQVGGGLFAKSAPSFISNTGGTNNFGFAAPQTTTNNPFGATAPVKPFSSTPNTQTLFGMGTPQPTNTFGQTPFGQTNQNVGFFKPTQNNFGAIGQNNTFAAFGNNSSQAGNGLFQQSKSNTSMSLFGQPTTGPTAGFGQSNFNQTNTNPFGGFNKPNAPLFGQPNTNSGMNNGIGLGQNNSLFGAKPNNLFGNVSNTGFFGNTGTFGNTNNFGFGVAANLQVAVPEQNVNSSNTYELLQLSGSPFGISTHLGGLSATTKVLDISRTTNPLELRTLIDTTMKNNAKTSPNNNKLKVTPLIGRKVTLFDGLGDTEPKLEQANFTIKGSAKSLVIKDKLHTYDSTYRPNAANEESYDPIVLFHKKPNMKFSSGFDEDVKSSTSLVLSSSYSEESEVVTPFDNLSEKSTESTANEGTEDTPRSDLPTDRSDEAMIGSTISTDSYENSSTTSINVEQHPTGIILYRAEYYTVPPLDDLPKCIASDGTCVVKGFTIGRVGYGNVYFPDPIDITDLNIDEIVHFRHKELTIYPDDSKKPPLGEGLNRRAQITLDRVWPRDKVDGVPITQPERLLAMDYAGILKRISEKHNSRFVEYRPETGSWVFKVDHFSKYGLSDSDEEEGVKDFQNVPAISPQLKASTAQVDKEEGLKLPIASAAGAQINRNSGYLFKDLDMYDSLPSKYEMEEDPEYIHSINLMKASFFQQEHDNFDIMSVSDMSSCDLGILRVSALVDNMQDMYDDDNRSEINSLSAAWLPECFFTQLVVPGRVVPRPMSACSLRNVADMAVFKGRSFKVGWGPKNSLVCLTSRYVTEEFSPSKISWTEGRNYDDFSVQMVQHLQINNVTNIKMDPFMHTVNDHMETQLKMTVVRNVYGSMLFEMSNEQEILLKEQHALIQNFSMQQDNLLNGQIKYYLLIIELIMAFWDKDDNSVEERRQKFSDWLQVVLTSTIMDDDCLKMNSRKTEIYSDILMCLSAGQIKQASQLALSNKVRRLSLILSQLNSNEYNRSLLQTQLQQWENSGVIKYIDESVIKLYLLACGKPVLGSINVCDEMDWKRALAIHFWYICPSSAPVTTSILEYEEAFDTLEYAIRPNPLNKSSIIDPDELDVMFHLMQLYQNNCYPLSLVLNYSTHTDNPLDFRFSWFMFQIFKSLDVGYITLSAERFLTVMYASQLEQLGYWHWAIYVLSFVRNARIKANLISNVISRNISIDESGDDSRIEKTLIRDFLISSATIYSAKAVKSLQNEKYWQSVEYFLLMKNYIDAHQTAFDYIIPKLLLNEEYDCIYHFLNPMRDASGQIYNWDIQGGFVLDFIELNRQFLDEDFYQKLTLIQPHLSTLCRRVQYFKCTNVEHKLCIVELSKQLAVMVNKWFRAHDQPNVRLLVTVKNYIQQLILPNNNNLRAYISNALQEY